MLRQDSDRFSAIMAELREVFGKKLDELLVVRYFDVLKDVPLVEVEKCAREHMAQGKFFPKPRDLRPKNKRQNPDSDERGGRFPELYSEEWWNQRALVLRKISPKMPSSQSLDALNLATFGDDLTPDLVLQAERCYTRAWPLADYSGYPEAQR